MSQVLKVNRCLKDKAMDHIDHALGRPVDPMAETYRNHFAVDIGSALAHEMSASPHWLKGGVQGLLRFYSVTDEGRAALRDHLKSIGDKHRAFAVSFEGFNSLVVATTHAKARYSHWLDIYECRPDMTFKDYCQLSRVRLA